LLDRLKGDLAGAQLIIIGHSLAGENINAVFRRALSINSRSGLGGKIAVFMYSRDEGRAELLETRGTVIPNRSNRKQPFGFSKRLYKLRWRIEAAFNRLKDFRRIATRYDRLARNYLAFVCLAAALVWWI
jgi:transposase